MDWSEKMSAIIRELGISQKDIAEATGMTQGYVSVLTSGKNKNPSVNFIKRLCDKLGVSADYLVNDRGGVLYSDKSSEDQVKTSSDDVIDICVRLHERGYEYLSTTIIADTAMMPTFNRGDVAVYSPGLIDADSLYALSDGGKIIIRRLQFLRQEDAVLVISDNQQYQPRRLPLSHIEQYVTIVGRVVCRILFE